MDFLVRMTYQHYIRLIFVGTSFRMSFTKQAHLNVKNCCIGSSMLTYNIRLIFVGTWSLHAVKSPAYYQVAEAQPFPPVEKGTAPPTTPIPRLMDNGWYQDYPSTLCRGWDDQAFFHFPLACSMYHVLQSSCSDMLRTQGPRAEAPWESKGLGAAASQWCFPTLNN